MRRRHLLLAAVVAAALCARLLVAVGLANDDSDDGRLYTRLAHNVLANGVYAQDEQAPFHPTYIRVPGYPLFVAGVYRIFGDWNNTAVRAVQAVLDTATCGVIGWLGWLWSPAVWEPDRRRHAAFAGLVIAAVCPFTLIYPATLLSETLAMLLGTAAVAFTTRAAWSVGQAPLARNAADWAAAGLLAGIAALVRPESGLYLAIAGVMLIVAGAPRLRASSERARAIATVGAGSVALGLAFAAALAPWTVRNYAVFGIVQPLNPKTVSMPDEFVPFGYETWVRTWMDHPRYINDVLFNLDSAPIHTSQMPDSAFDTVAERARVDTLLGQYNAPPPDADKDPERGWPPSGMTPPLDTGFMQIARERIARHPIRYYVVLPVKRVLALWFTTHADFYPFSGYLRPLSDLDPDRDQQIWLPMFLALLLVWTATGWAGTWVVWRSPNGGRVIVLLALLIVPRLVLLSWLANPEPRYTVEFFPFVSALAAVWIASLDHEQHTAEQAPPSFEATRSYGDAEGSP